MFTYPKKHSFLKQHITKQLQKKEQNRQSDITKQKGPSYRCTHIKKYERVAFEQNIKSKKKAQ